jgi:hypothetical protein
MRKIKVNIFDKGSIQDAVKELNAYSEKTLEMKYEQVLMELGKLGEAIVNNCFSESGEVFFTSHIVQGNKCVVIAEGDNVMFLEFGTGVDTEDHSDSFEHEALPPIEAGSWSATEGRGTFARHGYWHYNGELYFGTTPKRGFWFASKEMKERAEEIVRKVFAR